MPAVAVGFQTAGLHNPIGLQHRARNPKTAAPMAVFRLKQFPFFRPQLVKDHRLEAQIVGHVEETFLLHHLPGVTHAAAIPDGDAVDAHVLQAPDQRAQSIAVGRARGWIDAVEIRLEENVLALHRINAQQVEGLVHARRAV